MMAGGMLDNFYLMCVALLTYNINCNNQNACARSLPRSAQVPRDTRFLSCGWRFIFLKLAVPNWCIRVSQAFASLLRIIIAPFL